MIFLVEKLPLTLGTEGKFIFENKYKSLNSLEKYALKWIMKKYPKVQISVYNGNIYGTPKVVYLYDEFNWRFQIYPVKSI